MLQGYWHLLPRGSRRPSTILEFLGGVANPRHFPMGHHLPDAVAEAVVVYADYIPPFSPAALTAHVRLQKELEGRIKILARDLDLRRCVGVHVRKSDKSPATGDPIAAVARAMQQSGVSNRPVFLATDNPDMENRFRKVFADVRTAAKIVGAAAGIPTHIWAENQTDKRIARTVLEEGIVDMWLLSMCDVVLYQGNSAFSRPSRALHPDPAKQIDWDR